MSGQIDNHPRYSPRFSVTVGDTTYQEPGGRIADLVVETVLDGADRFQFALNYPFDEEQDEFAGLNWDDFAIGTDVEIAMGYGDDGTLTPLLTGTIETINAEFTRDIGPSVQISGYGLLWQLMQGSRSDSWTECTIGDAVREILSSYSFSTTSVKQANIRREKLIQDDRSDYRFLQKLADVYGFEFYAERETVRFVPQEIRGASKEPVAELWYGEALHDFFTEIQQKQDDHKVEVRAWDATNKTEIVATAGKQTAANKEVFRVPAMSRTEADQIAETKLHRLADGVASGHGQADGIPELRAGSTVKLAELGRRFSGTYYVTQATHRMGEHGYRTTFEATEVAR